MTWLVNLVLDWLYAKAADFIQAALARFKRQKEVKKEEEISVEPLKKANPESEKEIDDAIPGSLDGL